MTRRPLKPNVRRAVLVMLAVATLLLGYYAGNQFSRQRLDPGSVTLLPHFKPLPEFSLTDYDGEPFTRDSLNGRWHLVFFGYTYCPDICPTTLTRYTLVSNRLEAAPDVLEKTRVLFVSVDPKRDIPARLREYVQFFNPEFLGATGDPEEIRRLAEAFALFYQLHEPDANGNYLVDHSAAVAIVNPDAELVGYFTAVMDPEVIATDFRRLVEFFDT